MGLRSEWAGQAGSFDSPGAAALRLPDSDSRLRLESERLLESLRLLCRLMCSCKRLRLRPPDGECMPGSPRCLYGIQWSSEMWASQSVEPSCLVPSSY